MFSLEDIHGMVPNSILITKVIEFITANDMTVHLLNLGTLCLK